MGTTRAPRGSSARWPAWWSSWTGRCWPTPGAACGCWRSPGRSAAAQAPVPRRRPGAGRSGVVPAERDQLAPAHPGQGSDQDQGPVARVDRRGQPIQLRAPAPGQAPMSSLARQIVTVYRAIDQFGQVIDVFVSPRRDLRAARRFFERVGVEQGRPRSAVTDSRTTRCAWIAEPHLLVPKAGSTTTCAHDRRSPRHVRTCRTPQDPRAALRTGNGGYYACRAYVGALRRRYRKEWSLRRLRA